MFLGIEVARNRARRILQLSQPECTKKLLHKHNYGGCNSVATPLEGKLTEKGTVRPSDDPFPYRAIVGAAGYLQVYTRPDISYSQSALANFSDPSKTTMEHVGAAKHYLRYLRGTESASIVFTAPEAESDVVTVHASCDSDWAGDVDISRPS